MDKRQVELVQHTFARASRLGPHVAATFYAELFLIDPSLRRLFSGDMIRQGERLMASLRYIVAGISDPDSILPTVRSLAVRHIAYGVEAQHYPMVGVALLRTFKHELGRDFTPEAYAAWAKAYKLLSDAMCEAAYGRTETAGR